jgi:hypothetical protein
MNRIRTMLAVAVMASCALPAAADTLVPSNGGLTVTDDTTGITWLANGDIAQGLTPGNPLYVPGINPDGSMSLGTAQQFIDQLNADDYLQHDNWNLPSSTGMDGNCSYPSSGGNRFGFGCGAPSTAGPANPVNQLGGLFYNALGGQAQSSISVTHNASFGLFNNIKPYLYWSGTPAPGPLLSSGYSFSFRNGFQGTEEGNNSLFVLPEYTSAPSTNTVTGPVGLGITTPPPTAKPALVPSADGKLIYDPALNVTFLADANLAKSLTPGSPYYVSGINADGSMNLTVLNNLLNALNTNTFMGLKGWTVPTTAANGVNGDCSIPSTPAQLQAGFPDYGYQCDGAAGQLGELFYDELGGTAGDPITETGNADVNFFQNLRDDLYWEFGPSDPNVPEGDPSFSFESGLQGSNFGGDTLPNGNNLFVILEVPGDAIPEPSTIALFAAVLGLIWSVRRRVRI